MIVGSTSLPIRCADILLQNGHRIDAVVTKDTQFSKWAELQDVPVFETVDSLRHQSLLQFDYLFSIVNYSVLRPEFLELPRKMAINYHDGPLPRYAGMYATSWAIINGEDVHGVTWHMMNDEVDGGAILIQRTIEVDDDETAASLNLKCYDHAAESFRKLVESLQSGLLVPIKQEGKSRSYFPRWKRPEDGGIIDWDKPAAEIAALIRGLDFGTQPNPLGTAKLLIGGELLFVPPVKFSQSSSRYPAGVVTTVEPDLFRVAAADGEIEVRNLSTLSGQPVAISELEKRHGLRRGLMLPRLSEEESELLNRSYNSACRHESYWVKRLYNLEPATPALPETNLRCGDAARWGEQILQVPASVRQINARFGWDDRTFIVSALVALIGHLNGKDEFDIALLREDVRHGNQVFDRIFSKQVPLHVKIDYNNGFELLYNSVQQELADQQSRPVFLRDIGLRYPRLKGSPTDFADLDLPIAVRMPAGDSPRDFEPRNSLTAVVGEGAASCRLIFDSNTITSADIERFSHWFTVLMEQIASDGNAPLRSLNCLSEAEYREIVYKWDTNVLPYPKDKCIHQLFEAQAARTPGNTALIVGDRRISYEELNQRSNRLAHHLTSLGIGTESLVGVCLERSEDLIVALLAVLKSGGAYVPLDPSYPQQRITQIVTDSRAEVVITREDLSSRLSPYDGKTVFVDSDAENIGHFPDYNPVSLGTSRSLAYVIYTSGSTGIPKGVAIEHRSANALIHWALSEFTAEQLRGVLASTSVCFDLSVFEMFVTLSSGGTVILSNNVLELPDLPAANEVTLINTVPSAAAELLRMKGVPASVKTFNLAGEPLSTALVRRIYEETSVQKVIDLYGPSEDTTYSTFAVRDTKTATIGRPIANTRAYILDRFMNPVPAGIAGELYLAGDGLARGYLNRPETTAERFVPDPFSNRSDDRLYRTGDLARYLPNGQIEYLGRIDNQVKIRGFRIELGEIEYNLSAIPEISESIVVARTDESGDKRLIAYFVAKTGSEIDEGELRASLREKLPDYMVPSAFVELSEMPLMPNGKIDRKALPEPAVSLDPSKRDFVEHRDPTELKLVTIWESILGIGPIGVRDNFFDLGGHSLQAVRMFAEVEAEFSKNVPLATLFEASTIEKLADILRQDGWTAPESSLVPIQPLGTKPPFFCIHAKGGNVLFYRDLARHLGNDQPFYGLQARRLGGRQVGHSSVEEMAEFYIKEIKEIQPEGPYHLGGSSFGGLAAFEMARQLHSIGDEVAMLALFDTGTPDYPRVLPGTTRLLAKLFELIRRAQLHRDRLSATGPAGKAGYVGGLIKKASLQYRRRVRNSFKKAVRKFYQNYKGDGSIPSNYIQIEDQIWRAGQKYVPRTYPGRLTLFRASRQPLGIHPDPTLGWDGLAEGGIEIHEVEGHHGSIIAEPYVSELAAKLAECIEKSHGSMEHPEPVRTAAAVSSTFANA